MFEYLSKETVVDMLDAESRTGMAVEDKLRASGAAVVELVEHIESRDDHIVDLQDDIVSLHATIETQRNRIDNLESDLEIAEDRIVELVDVGLAFTDDIERIMTDLAQDAVSYLPVDVFMEYGLHHFLPVIDLEDREEYVPNFILVDINHIETR